MLNLSDPDFDLQGRSRPVKSSSTAELAIHSFLLVSKSNLGSISNDLSSFECNKY